MEFMILDSWSLIESEIVTKFLNREIQEKEPIKKSIKKQYSEINKRLKYSLYSNLDHVSCIHSLEYVFYKIRSGIFVSIRNNTLEAFIPFANKHFVNNWYSNLTFYTEIKGKSSFNNVHQFIQTRKKYYRYDKNYLMNPKKWWVNAYILNNEKQDKVWGQHSLKEYYDLLQTTLKSRTVHDCYFIINKRDHPIIHKDLHEPYPNMYFKDKPLPRIERKYQYTSYIPILSPYTNENYLDIPFIIPQDWQLASADESYYKIENEVKWEDKIPTALFRGSATGSMELEYNQRLQISKLDYEWNKTKPDLLDAGITSWNSRDKIDSKLQVNYIKPKWMNKLGVYIKPKIPMNEQIKYKYIVNIDGHSNPNRTSYLLQMGCLILMVESKYVVGNTCWYTNLLQPYKHYIPICYDLYDLEEKIHWCRENDKECKKIVQNAKKIYNTYFNKESLMDYCAYTCNQISNAFT